MYRLAPQGPYMGANAELSNISPYSTMYELNTGNRYPWLGDSSTGRGVTPTNRKAVVSFGAKKPVKRKQKQIKKKIGYTIKKGKVVTVYKFKGLTGRRYSNKIKLVKGKRMYKKKADATKASKKVTKRKKKVTKKTVKWIYYDDGSRVGNYSESEYNKGKGCSRRTNEVDCYSNPNCAWDRTYCKKKLGSYSGPMGKSGFGSHEGVGSQLFYIPLSDKFDSTPNSQVQRYSDYNSFGKSINPANKFNYTVSQYATNSSTPSISQLNRISSPLVDSRLNKYREYIPLNNFSGMGF